MGNYRTKHPCWIACKGKVTKITAFGAFVELDNGIEALIHVTELSDRPFGKVEDVIAKGDDVTAKVIKLDPEHKKVALSVKEYLVDRNQYNADDIVVGDSSKDEEEEDEPEEEAVESGNRNGEDES